MATSNSFLRISVFVLFVLISAHLINAQSPVTGALTTFTAKVSVYNDPTVSGRLSGQLYYNSGSNVTKRIDLTVGPSDIMVWQISSTSTTATKYTKCDSQCDAGASSDPVEYLFLRTNDRALGYTVSINGVTCAAYERFNYTTQPNSVQNLFVDSSNNLCRVKYYSGKTMDLTSVSSTTPAGIFTIQSSWRCPQPTCNAMIDLIYLFDLSGSISNANFELMRNFAYNLSDAFTIGSEATRIGIIFFATNPSIMLPLSNSKTTVLNTISTFSRISGSTYIGKGIKAVNDMMPDDRNGVQVTKIMIIMTDAAATDSFSTWYTQWKALSARGVSTFTIGVGSINTKNLWNMTTQIPGVQTQWISPTYSTVGNILNQGFVAQTCQPLPGVGSCGVNCKGYCSCGRTCLCPDDCNDDSLCTSDTCNVNQNAGGCQNINVPCNDNNLCTDDYCSATGGCYYVNKTANYCDDGIPCTIDTCVPSIGCQNTQRDCNDNNPCTADSCDAATGNCINTINYGCVCDTKTCPAADKCSVPSCDRTNGNCLSTALDCNDNNVCTDDSCNPSSGCVRTPKNCTDSNLCTTEFCDSSLPGGCYSNNVVCNDNDVCTTDSCNPSTGCVYTNVNDATFCDDNDKCTIDTCVHGSVGCIHTAVNCDDGNACTTDSCNAATGQCQHVSIPSCVCSVTVCPFLNNCTLNTCNNNNGQCESKARTCDDNSVCTIDTCNNSTGCVFTPKVCNDNNLCTTDSCNARSNPTTGCVFTNITCNDNDVCTNDACAPDVGCVFTNKSADFCDDSDPCTIDSCVHGGVGCIHIDKDCDDGDSCTTDFCDENSGECQHVISYECVCARTTCPFINNCTINTCNTANGLCAQSAVNCNDNNICTDDTCIPASGCSYTAHVCNDNNACTVDTCDRTVVDGCVFTQLNASTYDDNDECTVDSCDPVKGVEHTPLVCDDNNACTVDTCGSVTGCLFLDKDCGEILGAEVASKCTLAMCNSSDSTGFGCHAGVSPNAQFDECGECFGKGLNCVSKVTIGIGAGVISAIVIGSLAVGGAIFAGSYGGVKAYQKYRTTMEGAVNNPLFVEKQTGGDNPLYNPDAVST